MSLIIASITQFASKTSVKKSKSSCYPTANMTGEVLTDLSRKVTKNKFGKEGNGKLPAIFMVVAPGSWNLAEVWDDINRMKTLNMEQSRRRMQMHVCPLQTEIVERIINRFSNKGDLVYDPFGGLGTVPYIAIKMGRDGYMCELNPDYFRDAIGYLQNAEMERDAPTLFDFIGETAQ